MKTVEVCAECFGKGKIVISCGYQGSELSERPCPSCNGRCKPEPAAQRPSQTAKKAAD